MKYLSRGIVAGLFLLSQVIVQGAESILPSPGFHKVEDIVIYKDAKYHSAFPSIVRKPDGEFLLAFRRARHRAQ